MNICKHCGGSAGSGGICQNCLPYQAALNHRAGIQSQYLNAVRETNYLRAAELESYRDGFDQAVMFLKPIKKDAK